MVFYHILLLLLFGLFTDFGRIIGLKILKAIVGVVTLAASWPVIFIVLFIIHYSTKH